MTSGACNLILADTLDRICSLYIGTTALPVGEIWPVDIDDSLPDTGYQVLEVLLVVLSSLESLPAVGIVTVLRKNLQFEQQLMSEQIKLEVRAVWICLSLPEGWSSC